MKKLFLLIAFYTLCWSLASAQVPSGSVAPNFSGTDLNGNTYTLYDLLEEGKTVYIDLFATWCPPCWSYAHSGAMETIYNTYGPNGSDEAVVLAIEGDVSTNIECLYGLSGCDGGTEGDYVTGTPYPIIEDNGSINAVYGIGGFPVIYMICPADKIAWMPGTLSANELWNFRASHCANSPLSTSVNTVRNVKCFGSSTGSIDIDVGGGLAPYTYNWSNGLHTQDLNNLPAGVYTCTVTAASAATNILGPITVENPPGLLAVTLLESLPAGCHGIGGSLSIAANNGWGNYSYHWNTGQTDPLVTGLSAGTYTVTVTDDLLCTKTFSAAVANPTYPTILMASPGIITCAHPTTQIDATASSSGTNFSYHWEASNGGIITDGDTT
ncbi:MAG: redoxin family protein, partial [Phycisphaerae bacterium]|nr:redoxin family protein [Saprospiraceae bacterium]